MFLLQVRLLKVCWQGWQDDCVKTKKKIQKYNKHNCKLGFVEENRPMFDDIIN